MGADVITVGLGDIKISNSPDSVLVCFGLGSCVGVSMYDRRRKIGGVAHVVLPSSSIGGGTGTPGKYADTAINALLEELMDKGASKHMIQVKIAGGARMFSSAGLSSVLDVGRKNTIAVKEALQEAGLELNAEDCGGNYGRTMQFFVKDGTVLIRSLSKSETAL